MTIQVKGYRQQAAEARGLRFSYLEWGSRGSPAMVLLHGLTSHAHSWDVFADALQERYHIFALDQRGHGDSQWPDPPAFATDHYVDDLRALSGLWGIDSFVLIGLSMGAHNSLAFAARYPEMVEKLVPVDIGPAFRRQANQPIEPPQREFASLDEMFARAREQNPRPTDDMLRYRVEHNARRLPDGRWTFKYSPAAPRHWQPADLWETITTIRCPTLVVRGSESNVLSQEVAEREAAAIPGARLAVIEGSGHPVPLDRPAEFERVVREFLAS
jgi:pimeloyl-ACP methyl ester carboxylesterase